MFDRFPGLQIIVGHQFEALSWMAWRAAARQFLDHLPINPADREKIAHRNAEHLLGL